MTPALETDTELARLKQRVAEIEAERDRAAFEALTLRTFLEVEVLPRYAKLIKVVCAEYGPYSCLDDDDVLDHAREILSNGVAAAAAPEKRNLDSRPKNEPCTEGG